QAGGRQRNALAPDDLDDFLLLWQSRVRASASAARRDPSAQAAQPAASWISARERAQVFCATLARDGDDLLAGAVVLLAAGAAAAQDRERSGVKALYRRSTEPGRRRRVRRRP